jgi:hypothetical protein
MHFGTFAARLKGQGVMELTRSPDRVGRICRTGR